MKRKRYWITRAEESGLYYLWLTKPEYNRNNNKWTSDRDFAALLFDDTFEPLTGIKLKGGPKSIICISGFRAVRCKDEN